MSLAALATSTTAVTSAGCDGCDGARKATDAGTETARADAGGDAGLEGGADTGSAPPSEAGSTAADGGQPSGPWNVVVLSIDSLRADMPWAGYPRPIAPRLTALAARSTVYRSAYSISSFTSKSVAGMLSGRYPSSLERTGGFFTSYLGSNTFFAETCAAQSPPIPTGAGHAHAYFGKGQSGFEQGFARWSLVPGITFDYNTDPYVTSDKLTPLAIETLSALATLAAPASGGSPSRPFFAWFHFMDPHDEYKEHAEAPREIGKAKARDRYDQEVFYTDLWVGKLLDWMDAQPWAERTVVVVTADHGEAFGEHGLYKHAHELWEEVVHVPLFFHVPGRPARAIDTRRGHVDLVPTYLELLGVPADPTLPGTSLAGELFGGEAAPRDVVCDLPQDEYNERRRAFFHDRHKLIAFGEDLRFSLFDVESDPREATDLATVERETLADMKRRYREASARIPNVPPRGGIPKH